MKRLEGKKSGRLNCIAYFKGGRDRDGKSSKVMSKERGGPWKIKKKKR